MKTRTVRTWADHEGVHVEIQDGDGSKLAGAYEFVRDHGSWEGAKQAAIARARTKLDAIKDFGPPPEMTTEPLEEGELHVVS